MSQLYAQLAGRPDPWLIGRTSAGLCTLQTACPLTVTYSGGTPAADTIAAGSAATVYGSSAATFDASADVWVVFTAPGSGVLQVVKEADLATVTGDWAGCARVVQHSTEPYQPQAYLASGGTGGAPTTTLVGAVSDTAARAKSLWTGSANAAPPASWETLAYDDSAWGLAVVGYYETTLLTPLVPLSGTHIIWSSNPGLASQEQTLIREHFTLPAGTIVSATLEITFDSTDMGLYVNGVSLGTPQDTGSWQYPAQPDAALAAATVAIPPSALVAGGANVLAIWDENSAGDLSGGITAKITVTYGGGASVPAPGSPHEGDLLYYHGGAWQQLPIGSSGKLLTSDGTDPGWATPAGSGTVTSVALSMPAEFSVAGSPLTGAGGTLAVTKATEAAHTVYAGPSSGTAVPTFRVLAGSDLPAAAGAGGHVHAHGKFL